MRAGTFGMVAIGPGCMQASMGEMGILPTMTTAKMYNDTPDIELPQDGMEQDDIAGARRSFRLYMKREPDAENTRFSVRVLLDFTVLDWAYFSIPASMGLFFMYVLKAGAVLVAGAVFKVGVIAWFTAKFQRVGLAEDGDNRVPWMAKLGIGTVIAGLAWVQLLAHDIVLAAGALVVLALACGVSVWWKRRSMSTVTATSL